MTMIDPTYVEAILTHSKEELNLVEEWLTARSLQPIPMRAGLLVTGTRDAFEAAFGVDLANARPPVQLEVPPELREAISSIVIPPPRRFMP
jgi:hypothetical protein